MSVPGVDVAELGGIGGVDIRRARHRPRGRSPESRSPLGGDDPAEVSGIVIDVVGVHVGGPVGLA